MPVPLARISPHLVRAIIAIEDQRFYDHGGVDPIRIVGAIVTNVFGNRPYLEGASTITQQLARQAFLSRAKTYQRKLREVVLATGPAPRCARGAPDPSRGGRAGSSCSRSSSLSAPEVSISWAARITAFSGFLRSCDTTASTSSRARTACSDSR